MKNYRINKKAIYSWVFKAKCKKNSAQRLNNNKKVDHNFKIEFKFQVKAKMLMIKKCYARRKDILYHP